MINMLHHNFKVNFLSLITAVPKRNPYITGQKSRYSVGEVVDLNCTSNASLPEAELSWYVNSVEVRNLKFLHWICDKVNTMMSGKLFEINLYNSFVCFSK